MDQTTADKQLASGNTFLADRLVSTQLVKEFSGFRETQWFIIFFTNAGYWRYLEI
jgi:hypothetical protein